MLEGFPDMCKVWKSILRIKKIIRKEEGRHRRGRKGQGEERRVQKIASIQRVKLFL